MISTLSKQGGRRYPQMRAAWSAHVRLDSVGAVVEEVVGTLIGTWSHVIPCQSANIRIDCQSQNARIDCQSSNQRIET